MQRAQVSSLEGSNDDETVAYLSSQVASANLLKNVIDLEHCHGLNEHQLAYQVAAKLMRGRYSTCRYQDESFPPSDLSLYPGGVLADSSDAAALVARLSG